jgi:WD40 repeat protein
MTQAKPEAINSWNAKMVVNGAVFAPGGSRFLSWDAKGNVELRNVNQIKELVDSWNAEGIKGAAFMKDGSGFFSWGDAGILRLWDMTKAEPLVQWKPGGRLSGAVFNNNETRILVWGDAGLTLWNYALSDPGLESDKRILQLEVCSATQLDKKGRIVGLDMKDWSAKYKEVESWLKCH